MGDESLELKIAGLYRFPVKSLGGERIESAQVDHMGIRGDRRWMVVNTEGRFVTRRELPQLVKVDAFPNGDGVLLRNSRAGEITIRVPGENAIELPVKIWRDTCVARLVDTGASAWLSEVFETPLRIVYMANVKCRPVSARYALAEDFVSFADGFPILVTTTESLAALNERLIKPVAMARFRPNIVLSGARGPWVEHQWRRLRIGTSILRLVKPCVRCVVITQDPATGESSDGNEPLVSLRAMGQFSTAGTIFGQNAIPEKGGNISVGDTAEILG